MSLQPLPWIEEQIELMALYHPRRLIVITFVASLLFAGVVFILLYKQVLPGALRYILGGTTFVGLVAFLFKVFQALVGRR